MMFDAVFNGFTMGLGIGLGYALMTWIVGKLK